MLKERFYPGIGAIVFCSTQVCTGQNQQKRPAGVATSRRRGVDATRRRVDLRDATRRRGRARARDVDVLSVNVLRVSRNGRYVGVRCKGYRLEGSGTGSDPPDLETP